MKILVSCLEASANLHFKEVFQYLNEHEIYGIFEGEFGTPIYKSSEFSAMGFVEILPLIFKAKRALKQMVELSKNCDRILLIDSPAFNLLLAKKIKDAFIKAPITYYILPQVWAWKKNRVAKVEKYCENLASILPFDSKFYNRATYVGHPLLDEIKVKKNSISNNNVVAFLPGSRRFEITRLMPIYKEVASKLKERKLLVVPSHFMENLDELYGDVSEFDIVNDTPKALFQSDFAFICSGTASLEAALIGTPFVLCYKAKSIDMWLAKKFVKLNYVGLANIIFDFMNHEPLNLELLQEEATAKNLLKEYENCNRNKFIVASMMLREYLSHGSSKNLADMILRQI